RLEAEGPRVVTAGDLQCPAGVEVLNPELVLAHLNETGKLALEAKVERGRGYSPAAEREEKDRPIGTLVLDASFSPIRRVAVQVEKTRVGQRTDYDKLILEVETNGAITPEEAVNEAARILMDQLEVFADFSRTAEAPKPKPKGRELDELLARSIDDLEMSWRTSNTLKAQGIMTVGELVRHTPQELLRTPNFGRKSLAEIEEALARHGLRLGMQVEEEGVE
ncbi:MAG: DNA-directed RNA polymerase subunit alpha, partial [Zetaproteobacteria bacterium]